MVNGKEVSLLTGDASSSSDDDFSLSFFSLSLSLSLFSFTRVFIGHVRLTPRMRKNHSWKKKKKFLRPEFLHGLQFRI